MSIVENKEVVRIIVKKFNGRMQPECRKLCVDPQLTSFDILQHLLVKAFDIKTDFAIYYLATDDVGQSVYLSLLSDWDLDAAFFGASTPFLSLKVDLKPFEDDALDEEWDVVAPCDVGGTETEASNISSSLRSFVNRKVSEVIRAIGLRQPEVKDFKPQKAPMSDAEFHNFLDAVGNLIQPQQFRLSVYQGGVELSLRRVVWRHLLNIYPENMTGRERFDYLTKKSKEYFQLRDDWFGKDTDHIQNISNMVRKDVLRTDRTHPFFAGTDENQNVKALFNLLVTYALTHPVVGYCQGMSDLASPILVIEKDEAHAYICFCALMKRLETNFSADGLLMTSKFEHLSLLLQHYDPVFADYLKQQNADMFFCYRWILLEMKREFPLDDAFYMLEVMWSTLPLDPPETELALFGPGYLDRNALSVSPSVLNYIQLRTLQRRLSTTQSMMVENSSSVGIGQGITPTGCSRSIDSSDLSRTVPEKSIDFDQRRNLNDTFHKTPLGKKSDHVTAVAEEQEQDQFDTKLTGSTGKEKKRDSDREVQDSLDYAEKECDDEEDDNSKLQASNSSIVLAEDDLHTVELSSCEEADEQTTLLDPAFVNVSDVEKLVQLPPPTEFGCGNPFLMFLCLSLLLQHRDHVMTNKMDYNEMAVFFDRMVRKHDVNAVVHHAKSRYALYLRHQQQLMTDSADSDLNV